MQQDTKTIPSTHRRKGPPPFAGSARKRTSHRDRPAAPASQNAQRNYERYIALARAAALTGDRVETENYYQHAEHYLRTMREQAAG